MKFVWYKPLAYMDCFLQIMKSRLVGPGNGKFQDMPVKAPMVTEYFEFNLGVGVKSEGFAYICWGLCRGTIMSMYKESNMCASEQQRILENCLKAIFQHRNNFNQ